MTVQTRAGYRASLESRPEYEKEEDMGKSGGLTSSDEIESEGDEWIIPKLNLKKGEKGRSRGPTPNDEITTMEQKTDRELEEFLIEKIKATVCGSCRTKGKWIKGRKDSRTGSWIWCCGGLSGQMGCSRTVTQGTLYGYALGFRNSASFRKEISSETYKRMGRIEVHMVIPMQRIPKRRIIEEYGTTKEEETAARRVTPTPCNGTRTTWIESLRSLLSTTVSMIDQATTLEEAKGTNKILNVISDLLNNNNIAHGLESARPGNIKYDGEGNKRTFAQATAAYRPPLRTLRPMRLTVEQINLRTEDKEERKRLAFNAMAWKKKAPISRRMLKEGEVLEEGPLKHNVDSLEFVHVVGVGRMRYGEMRSLLGSIGVNTREIRDISFVGGSICSLLVSKEYKKELVKVLVFEGSPLSLLNGFNPLSNEHIRRKKWGSHEISPTNMFIRRAASAIANNRKLEVATIYQMQLPAELREQLRLEVQKILDARTGQSKRGGIQTEVAGKKDTAAPSDMEIDHQ